MNLTFRFQQILSLRQEETLVLGLTAFFLPRATSGNCSCWVFCRRMRRRKIPGLPPSPLIAWTIRRIGRRKKPALAAAVRRPTARC